MSKPQGVRALARTPRVIFPACRGLTSVGRLPGGADCFRFSVGTQARNVPYRPYLHSHAGPSPEPRRSTLDPDRGYYGEAPARVRRGPHEGLVQAWCRDGAQSRAFWGVELGLAVSPKGGKAAIGEWRGKVWRLKSQDGPASIPPGKKRSPSDLTLAKDWPAPG